PADLEAFAFLTELLLRGHAKLLERELAEGRRVSPHHLEFAAAYARLMKIGYEGGDTAVLLRLIGNGVDEAAVGDRRVRDPDFRSVQDVIAAVARRGRAYRGDVRAGVRLGDGEAADFLALDQRRQPALSLRVVAEAIEDQRRTDLHGDKDADGAVRARELLGEQPKREEAEPVAAAVLADRRAVKAELAHLRDQVPAEFALAVVSSGSGRDFLRGEIAREVAHGDQLFA